MIDSHPYRFRKANRLLDAASYSRVFKRATRSRDRYFTVLCRPAPADQPTTARLGLAISKKNCKLATGRTRLKRLVRESFRAHKAELTGLDIVVMNAPAAVTARNAQLFDSLRAHWKRCASEAGAKPAAKDPQPNG